MSGIELSFGNLWRLLAALSPILIGFFMLMLSLINQNIKGIVYIAGAIFALFLNIPIQQSIDDKDGRDDENIPITCGIISLSSIGNYRTPSSSSLFIAFTFAYLILPMINSTSANYAIVVSLLAILGIDATAKIESGCTTFGGAILGSLLGFAFGFCWYTLFNSIGATTLLYNTDLESNALKCDKPSEETFKCTLYQNRQPVSTNGQIFSSATSQGPIATPSTTTTTTAPPASTS